MEKLIAVAGFPVIYDVPQTQQLDHPSWYEFDKKARNTIYRGHFPNVCFSAGIQLICSKQYGG